MTEVELMEREARCTPVGARRAHEGRRDDRPARQRCFLRTAALLLLTTLLGTVLWRGDIFEALPLVASPHWITGVASRYGPVVIVALMVVAVVASPVPSGPIALAAGALYGTLAGGCLAVIGAFCGAMVAFALSRRFGYRALSNSTHPAAHWIVRSRSQNRMMLLVMASRLVPFISFDAVSYCAGLTQLQPWRFAVATFLGVVPVAFAFAAMGAGMAVCGMQMLSGILACTITIMLPTVIWLRNRGSTP